MIVAIRPPKTLVDIIQPQEGMKNLHLTLAFIDKDENVTLERYVKAVEACLRLKSEYAPFEVHLTEVDRFENVKMMMKDGELVEATEPTDAVFVKGEGTGIYSLRAGLVDHLTDLDCAYSMVHRSFKAHMTIGYVPHGTELETSFPLPQTFLCEQVELWVHGDTYPFPLEGAG